MKEITTREELKEAQGKDKSVILFGLPDCLHCSIAHTVVESLQIHFPLIDFYYTYSKSLPNSLKIDRFPVLHAYENGNLIATLHGCDHLMHLRDHLNLWFRKD